MAEVIGITSAVLGILGAVVKLSTEIPKFVSDIKQSSEDMMAVGRELEAICVPLSQLKQTKLNLPIELQTSLLDVLKGCQNEVDGLSKQLQLSQAGYGKALRWILAGKGEITTRRVSLESHKATLNLTLTLSSL